MPGIVLKLARDADAYAVFSTVVDGFVTGVLTREQMFNHLRGRDERPDELIEARLVRADICGSSMHDGTYGFDNGPILFLNGGASNEMVERSRLLGYARDGIAGGTGGVVSGNL